MWKGKPWISMLIVMVFLGGMIAPVPECYVLGLACPVKASFAAQVPLCKGGVCPASGPSCCSKALSPDDLRKKCSMTGFKPRMKSYLPEIETLEVPTVGATLPPSPFHAPFLQGNIASHLVVEHRSYIPDPVPILLRKQSFLI